MRPTAWIAEGLMVYLPPDAQDRMLDKVTTLSAPGSRFASENISDMRPFTDDRNLSWRNRWRRHGLELDEADLVWEGERHEPARYLASAGWQVTRHSTEELYAANGFCFPDDDATATYRQSNMIVAERTRTI
jgi:methyltransferase (TIGR00027 family)